MSDIYNADNRDVFPQIVKEHKNIIVVSDPPFNVGYKYNTYNDKMDENEYYEMLTMFFADYPSVVIHYPESLYKLSFFINDFPTRVFAWVYNSNTQRQHMDIAFFKVNPDTDKVRQPYKNINDKRIAERMLNGCDGSKLYDWFEVNQIKNVSNEKTKHPCQMPLEVMENIIGVLPDDAVIVDPFMGSGTTGVAVKIMNRKQDVKRKFIGVEIDKEYFEIAKQRINEATAQLSLFDNKDVIDQINLF